MIPQSEYPYWLALNDIPNLQTRKKNEIVVKCCHERQAPLSDLFKADISTMQEHFALSQEDAQLISSQNEHISNYMFQANSVLEQGWDIICIFDQRYPKSLKINMKYQAPVLLYTCGNIEIMGKKCTAIVGSRNANPTALNFTGNIAKKYASEDSPIVSGYAKGVDRQAFDSAVENGGQTIVVLPQGLGTFSSGLRSMYRGIIEGNILVISTYKPNAPWSVGLAMGRNSIIYGMADNIYVAQSDSKGGTWEGVMDGLKRSRTIYVREPELKEQSANALLIAKGCIPVTMNGDIVQIK